MSDDVVERIVMKGKSAEEIRRLRKENDRLREALRPFALIGDVTRDKLEDGLHSMPIKYYRIAADVMLEMIDD